MSLYPFTCIDESLYPWCDIVVFPLGGLPCVLPREDGSFQVGHHGKVTPISGTDARHVVIAAIGVARVFGIIVFSHDMILVFRVWQLETSFAMRYPYTELVSTEATQHHAVVLWNLDRDKRALELVGHIVS